MLRLMAVLMLAAVHLTAATAQADPRKAAEHFDNGTRLYEAGQFQQAIEQFQAAHAEDPDPSHVYNIAQCYRRLGQVKEALENYRRFLALEPETPLRAEVERKIEGLAFDQRRPATRPLPTPQLSPGAPAAARSTAVVDLRPSEASSRPARTTWPLWAGAVAAVTFSASAIVLGRSTNDRYDALVTSCGRGSGKFSGCPQADIDGIQRRTIAIDVLWALAGASAVATGTWLIAARDRAGVGVTLSF